MGERDKKQGSTSKEKSYCEFWYPMTGDAELATAGVEVGGRVKLLEQDLTQASVCILCRVAGSKNRVGYAILAKDTKSPEPVLEEDPHKQLFAPWIYSFDPAPINAPPTEICEQLKILLKRLGEELQIQILVRKVFRANTARGGENYELVRQFFLSLCKIIPKAVGRVTWDVFPFPGVTHAGDLVTLRSVSRQLGERKELALEEDVFNLVIDFPNEETSSIPHPGADDEYHKHDEGTFYQARDGRVVGFTLWNLPLGVLPPAIARLDALEVLRATSCKLTAISPWIESFRNLQELYLDGNALVELPLQVGALTRLKVLDLGGNHLTTLPPQVERLQFLNTLNLAGNPIEQLPETLSNLKALEELTIAGALHPEISLAPIKYLPNLRKLLLGLQDKELPTWMNTLYNLKELSFKNTGLTRAPSGAALPPNLEVLDLSYNQIDALPEDISCLRFLKHLNLDSNKLEVLPEGIVELENLENLNISHNKLITLPIKMSNLHSLKTLNLRVNQLKSLPETLCDLTSLEMLDLGTNQLTILPDCIGILPKLTFLRINSNRLQDLPPSLANSSIRPSSLKIENMGNPMNFSRET